MAFPCRQPPCAGIDAGHHRLCPDSSRSLAQRGWPIAFDLCNRIYADFGYDAATRPPSRTLAPEAFALRHGVCQDFSHVMISGLRGIGIPAGYVSGFIRTIAPPGKERLEGADAMHAWVRVWCGREMGWARIRPDQQHDRGQRPHRYRLWPRLCRRRPDRRRAAHRPAGIRRNSRSTSAPID
jgi:hypothetical protein